MAREDRVLALLDALGDLDLALAREERDAPHLAQVHADRVVRLRVVRVGLFLAPRRGPATFFVSVASSSAMRLGAIFTCVAASTISMSSSPSAPITSSTWSAATTSAGSASFTSS